jgi:hypothetical protein
MPRVPKGLPALFALGLAAAPMASGAAPPEPQSDGHRHDTITAECHAPAQSTCYFNILLYRGGLRPVKVKGGQKLEVKDLEVGKDLYLVMVDEPPPTSFATCRARVGDRSPCVWGLLSSSISELRSASTLPIQSQ